MTEWAVRPFRHRTDALNELSNWIREYGHTPEVINEVSEWAARPLRHRTGALSELSSLIREYGHTPEVH